MPVRSSNTRVLAWPNREIVESALIDWTTRLSLAHPTLQRLGYFGSYAHGNWGVGSDLDLVGIVCASEEPWERRALEWDTSGFPVPVDLLIYTSAEWNRMLREPGTLPARVSSEVVWVYPLR